MTSVQDIITALRNIELPEALHELIPEAAEILAEITVSQKPPAIDRRLLPLFTALRDRQITAADGEIVVRDVTGQGIAIGHGAQVITIHVHLSASDLPSQSITRDEVLTAFYQASSILRAYPGEIAGIHLERAEVGQIVEWIRSASPKERLGMLLDQPGSGKTVIMRDVLTQLDADHTPVLAIKADLLSGIKTRDELIKSLDLPCPVEECVRQLTLEGPVVILLDQLDALSLALSRDQATLDLVLSLLARLRDHEHVRIIASCRSFDLNNDPHLSKIKIDREFQLQPLDRGQVTHVLQAVGVDQAHLLPAHRTLLTTPLHLDIYAKIVADETVRGAESFRTLQELYEALWRKHIECAPPEHPTPATRIAAIYRLVDHLQDRRQLTAPIAVLDEHAEAAGYLERVGFIRREKSNWVFVHQTLFDYCYARRFAAQGRSLSQEISTGPQGLFERSQMVQVLAYLRGSDLGSYRRELTDLLFAQSLRTHLRLLLIGWFSGLSDPTADEIRLARRMLQDAIEGEYRKGVCRSLEKRADAGIPNDLLDLMTDWALHDPDPTQEMWRVSAGLGDQRYYGGDPLGHGINTVRGAALQAVTYCALVHKPPQVERAIQLLEAVADDPSTAVRACVVERLAMLMRHNTEHTLTIFEQTLDGHPELLQTVTVHNLLYHLYYRHFPRIRPFIEAMLSDEDDATRQAGGRLVCLAAFQYPEATLLAEQALQGDAWLRRGTAQVYAHNLGQQDVEATCQERLLQLMHDQDEEVRKYVGECFRQLHPEQVHRVRVLIEAFLASPALPLGARHLIDYLKPLAIDEQELALHATECLIDTLGHQIVDMQTSAALLEDDLAWLPLTVYTHADNDQMRARAMDTFEQFLLLGSWTAQEALTAWDRR